jgi:hypothetical protein
MKHAPFNHAFGIVISETGQGQNSRSRFDLDLLTLGYIDQVIKLVSFDRACSIT